MTPKAEKFYKVHVYYIASIVLTSFGVLSMFSGYPNESRNLSIVAIIFYATACIRGDILEIKRNK